MEGIISDDGKLNGNGALLPFTGNFLKFAEDQEKTAASSVKAESPEAELSEAKSASDELGWPFDEKEEGSPNEEFLDTLLRAKPSKDNKDASNGQLLGVNSNGLFWLNTLNSGPSPSSSSDAKPDPVVAPAASITDSFFDTEDSDTEFDKEDFDAEEPSEAEIFDSQEHDAFPSDFHIGADEDDIFDQAQDEPELHPFPDSRTDIEADAAGASRGSLMSAVMPYLAAACFFAFVAGGAVFYFVAVQRPGDLQNAELRESAESATAVKDFETKNDEEPAKAEMPADSTPPVQRQSIDLNTNAASAEARSGFEPKFDNTAPEETADAAKPDANGETLEPNSPPQTQANGANSALNSDDVPDAEPLKDAEPKLEASVDAGIQPNSPQPEENKPSQDDRQNQLPVQTATLDPPPVEKADVDLTVKQAAIPPSLNSVALPTKRTPDSQQNSTPPSAPRLMLSTEQETAMLDRGRMAFRRGDVAGARSILEYLAQLGSAKGAFVLAQTYDPAVLSPLGVRGLKGDPQMARSWYEKASVMGSHDALAQLSR